MFNSFLWSGLLKNVIVFPQLDRIPAGGSATHVAVIRPSKYGYFNFTSAEVSYLASEDATEVCSRTSDEF